MAGIGGALLRDQLGQGHAGRRSFGLAVPLLVLGLVAAGTLAALLGGNLTEASPDGGSAAPAPVERSQPHLASAREAAGVRARFAGLPLSFEKNAGQTDARVRFLSRGAGYTLFLTPTGAVLSLAAHPAGRHGTGRVAALRMGLVGANPRGAFSSSGRLPGTSNYFIGHRRHTGVANYAEVTYRHAYPGTDVVYHGRNGRLEYDFNLAPGADPNRIALDFRGAEKMTIGREGDLVLKTAAGTLRQPKPVVYQREGGARHEVAGRYVLLGKRRVGFQLGRYDHSRALVIDPEIVYSTYLGGTSNGAGDLGTDVAIDGSGAAYITGATGSPDFPTTSGAYERTYKPAGDPDQGTQTAFVSKLDTTASGTTSLVYSTFLGGTGFADGANGIAVDGSGNAYVTGFTRSNDYPTQSPLPGSSCAGPSGGNGSAFVTKLGATGSALVYSTCLGDPALSRKGNRIAVDASGAAYVTGVTAGGFPTTSGAYQTTAGGGSDAFLAKLKPAASDGLAYSSYLGGAGNEEGADVAVDGSGNAYLTGSAPPGFPTTPAAFQPSNAGGADAFVSKVDTTASGNASLKYSTYLGGGGQDNPFSGLGADGPPFAGITVQGGQAYVTGGTDSTDFPTQGPLQGAPGGGRDAFVTKLNTAGSALDYSTYLGGAAFDQGIGVAVDSSGRANLYGVTASSGFPTADALPGSSCAPAFSRSGLVSKLSPTGSALVYSTCIPGVNQGRLGGGIAVDSSDNAYVAGTTAPDDPADALEVVNGYQEPRIGGSDAYLLKLAPSAGGRPHVRSLAPRGGPASGDTRVVITGENFTGATAVSFGGTPAASVTVASASQITAVTPARQAGKAYVRVTNGAGSSPAQSSLADFHYGEGGWKATGSLTTVRRVGQSATLLPSGKVLVAGGFDADFNPLTAAELYNPKTGSWTATGGMDGPRAQHTATLLPSGKVLVTGGWDSNFDPSTSAELYDPGSGTWTAAPSMATPRLAHTATLLPTGPASVCSPNCGKVLVVGAGEVGTASAELYNPATNSWSATGSLSAPRGLHTATLLPGGPASVCAPNCGKVLVSGGYHGASAPGGELYNPTSGVWSTVPGGPTGGERPEISSGLLGNGRVLAAGGGCIRSFKIPSKESHLFDPLTGAWTPANPLEAARAGQGSVTLPSGKLLVMGGLISCQGSANTTAELFDPGAGGSGRWMPAGSMQLPRPSDQGLGPVLATLISSDPTAFAADPGVCGNNCGRVLITGGTTSTLAELYTPAPSISSVAPGGGPTAGGTSVTISGAGLNHGLRSVRFGGVAATSFSADSYGQITAVAPPHADGTVGVAVVTDGGAVTLADAFTYGDAGSDATPPAIAPGGPTRDTTPPVISRLSAVPTAFTIGSLLPRLARAPKVGTNIRFSLSERASVTLSFARRVGRRYRTARPSVRIAGRAGANRVRFQGRLSRRAKLRSGRYRLTATATDGAGNRSKPKRTLLTVKRRPRAG